MNSTDFALLKFSSELNKLGDDKGLCYGLSAVVQIGNSLWVTNDETISLERLTFIQQDNAGNHRYGHHKQFSLNDYLDLPIPPEPGEDTVEADVEGLAYENGYLWLVCSHSLKRNKPKGEEGVEQSLNRLAKVRSEGNRYLIARIPVVENQRTYTIEKNVEQDGKRRAAQLNGNSEGNDLTKELKKDEHLQSFLAIPGKDNGFDIEGLAIANGHLFLGLRGPVLRGWAVILEIELKEDNDSSSILRLKKIGPHNQPYRKHFVQLDSLGIRDLCVYGTDLLILAGPTMDLDGPIAIFRWPGGTEPKEESLVPNDVLERVIDVPYGQGVDHAEGLTLFSPEGGEPNSLLVVYDSASKERRIESNTTRADIFFLPSLASNQVIGC